MKVAAFVVQITEYERGWGQRLEGERYFDGTDEGLAQAERFVKEYNEDQLTYRDNNRRKPGHVPDVYWKASEPRLRLVDQKKMERDYDLC